MSLRGGMMGRVVIVVVDDMFFASKIRATAEALGVEVSFPRSKEALVEKARDAQLILVDLHNQKVIRCVAAELKADEQLSGVQFVGFFSHVETELNAMHLRRGSIRCYRVQCSRET